MNETHALPTAIGFYAGTSASGRQVDEYYTNSSAISKVVLSTRKIQVLYGWRNDSGLRDLVNKFYFRNQK